MKLNKILESSKRVISRSVVIVCTSPFLCAWVAPIDLDEDVNGMTAVTIGITEIDSCTVNTASNPDECHRWNLLWQPMKDSGVFVEQANWVTAISNDASGNEWRLPTIKELAKIIEFGTPSSSTIIESPVIKKWFTESTYWATNSVALGDGSLNVWLISSSFRDIDDIEDVEPSTGNAQVFAINSLTGEIKTFEPGATLTGNDKGLKLCESLKSDGTCSYDNGAVTQTIFALKVRTQTVTDLIAP